MEESRSWRGDRLPVEKESKGQKMYGHDRERIRLSNSSSLFPLPPPLLVKLASPCTRAFPVGKLCKVGQTGMTRRKVGRRISVTIDGPDLRTSAGRRNRPIDTRLLRKVENFARIYCRSSFEKLGNRNAWKINARHFSLLN